MSQLSSDLPAFPMQKAKGCPLDPPPEYAELRTERPVAKARLWDGKEVWLITGYDEIRSIFTDPRISVDNTQPGYPWLSEQAKTVVLTGGVTPVGRMDPPEHTAMRRMLGQGFLVKKIQGMRGELEALVNGLIDDIMAGPRPVDLVAALAMPVPATALGWILGVPPADQRLISLVPRLFDEDSGLDGAMAARAELFKYMEDLITLKESDPGDDIISTLVGYHRQGELSRPSVLIQSVTLVAAALDTTRSMITNGILALLQHPEQAAALIANPDLAPAAVEELLRYTVVTEFASKRVAAADIEIAGETIKAGDGIICLISAGNRDEKVFTDPDTLDIRRSPRQHLGFGAGIHTCIGKQLARMELEVVYGTLFRRIPGLRLAVPFDEVVFRNTFDVQGAKALPVTW
ncbi:cytochrome P450 [Kutzneria chonburiensis]|uniref:Cytochrome P450 n=1 Tax=Kutzneria chonburiensis TaxID=1483604 RepID=A0ABV6MNF6_9PSEU